MGRGKDELRILDAGCGLGLLLDALIGDGYKNVFGFDFDKTCVVCSSQYATTVQGDMNQIDSLFHEHFDVVIFSHSLEHMESPKTILKKASKIASYMIIAVPNPVRPKILLKYALFSKDYSNKGHYYSWDRSHLNNFLTRCCGLQIENWSVDRVKIFPLKPLRKFLDFLKVLDYVELKLLPKCFPYFSSCLITLCKKVD